MKLLGLKRGEERYIFLYDDVSVPQLLQTLGRYAADPELRFEWRDAAELAGMERGKMPEFTQEVEPPRRSYLGNLWRALIGKTP